MKHDHYLVSVEHDKESSWQLYKRRPFNIFICNFYFSKILNDVLFKVVPIVGLVAIFDLLFAILRFNW